MCSDVVVVVVRSGPVRSGWAGLGIGFGLEWPCLGVGKGAREGSRERHLGVVAGRACEKGKPGGRVTVRASSAEGGGVVGVGGGRRGGGGGAGEGKGRGGQGRAGQEE